MLKLKVLIMAFTAISFKFLLPTVLNVDGACSVCNTTISYACMSSTQYAKCNSTAIDLTTLQVCPSPTVCNETVPLNVPLTSIPCYFNTTSQSNAGVQISCPLPLQTYVINAVSSTPTAFCASRTSGLFTHPTRNCAWYIRCYYNDGTLLGAEYKCPGTTRFDSASRLCDTSVTC